MFLSSHANQPFYNVRTDVVLIALDTWPTPVCHIWSARSPCFYDHSRCHSQHTLLEINAESAILRSTSLHNWLSNSSSSFSYELFLSIFSRSHWYNYTALHAVWSASGTILQLSSWSIAHSYTCYNIFGKYGRGVFYSSYILSSYLSEAVKELLKLVHCLKSYRNKKA